MLRKKPRPIVSRKLLVAAVGVATVNYVAVACGGTTEPTPSQNDASTNPPTSGNLPGPQPTSTNPPTSGNLPSPQPTTTTPPTSGNLPSPQPQDAGVDDADTGVK